MSDVHSYLWLVPALPLAAAALIAALGPRLLRQHSHWPCVLATAGSCVCSLMLLFALLGSHESPAHGLASYYPLFRVGAPGTMHHLDLGVSFRADELTAIMLVMVTFI